jgi:hypothetical protein
MADFSVLDSFDPNKGYSQVKFGADSPLLETELNEMQKIMNHLRAEIVRSAVHSGVLDHNGVVMANGVLTDPSFKGKIRVNDSTYFYISQNKTYLGETNVVINGYKMNLPANTSGITLPDPPTFGTRDDLVFLEAWFEEYDFNKDSAIKDTRIGTETSRRVKLNWRIRTVAGVDFNKFPEGFSTLTGGTTAGVDFAPNVMPQGSLSSPLDPYNSQNNVLTYRFADYKMLNTYPKPSGLNGSDVGLYISGYGDSASKTLFGTADGYVYAIPLFRVKRRNSGGYRNDNLNGAKDYYSVTCYVPSLSPYQTGVTLTLTTGTTANMKVGDILNNSNSDDGAFTVTAINSSTTFTANYNAAVSYVGGGTWVYNLKSDRPDKLYSNIIDVNDIIDLRHKVSLTGFNHTQLLEQSFDQLLRGELRTKDTLQMKKERFGLTPAPYGLQPQFMPVTVKGNDGVSRDLVNLLGTDGNCERTDGIVSYSNIAVSLDSTTKTIGSNSIRATSTSYGSIRTYITNLVQTGKYYLVLADAKIGTVPDLVLNIETNGSLQLYSSQYTTDWSTRYIKFDGTVAKTGSTFVILDIETGHAGTFNVDAIRIYEVDKSTYDKIDVDAEFTGDKLAQKFPYVSSYPNVIQNLFNNQLGSPINGASTPINTGFTVTNATYYYNFPINLPSGTTIVADWDINVTSGITSTGKVFRFQYTDDSLSTTVLGGQPLTASMDVKALYIYFSNGEAVSADLTNIVINKGSSKNPVYVPFGSWLLPYDYASGDTATRIVDYMNGNQRLTWSDAQMTDTITDIVDPTKSPQKHVKVTQATAGQWSVNDTIQITSDSGVISGTSAEIANVTQVDTVNNVLVLTNVTNISTGDMLYFYNGDTLVNNWFVKVSATISNAIELYGETACINRVGVSAGFANTRVIEGSSSVPSVTSSSGNIAGTWSGLGTKTATFTITTAPSTNTDLIKIQYAVSYPSGKGINQVPYDVLEGKINGDRLIKASDGIVHIKANFAGKVVANTDLVPHIAKYAFQPSVQAPSSSNFNEYDTGSYKMPSVLGDGVTTGTGSPGATLIAQELYSFDIVRAITDKLGEGVWADCVTLADKVAKAKTIVTKLTGNWYGYGSSPTGNKATFAWWLTDTSKWETQNVSHTQGSVALLSRYSTAMSSVIDSNGFCHFLAYADPSDGVTASTISTDYVELELQLNVAETGYDVLIPENNFPHLSENLLIANQAFPLDTTGFSPSGGGGAGALYMDSIGVVACSVDGAVSNQGILISPFSAISGNRYTISFDVECTNQADIAIKATNGGLNTLISSTVFTAIKNKQRLFATFTPASGSNGAYATVVTNVAVATTIKISNVKLELGNNVKPQWSAGLRKTKLLNFLGKVAGSPVENPHRAMTYDGSGTFENPTSSVGWTSSLFNQTMYDGVSKQDGTLTSVVDSRVGFTSAQYFEFDLSHLGLSLAELKSALRNLTVNWTGYGSGDNGGILTNGATLKVWNNSSSIWDFMSSNSTSTPSTLSYTVSDSNAQIRITKDQKVYFLVHSTYPASATYPSEIYTDYVSLTVTLADYVDYVKGNVVKVRKETKEVKLVYPKKSYRSGMEDMIDVLYRYVPYQGTFIVPASSLPALDYMPFITTIGTATRQVGTVYSGATQQGILAGMLPTESGSMPTMRNDNITIDGETYDSIVFDKSLIIAKYYLGSDKAIVFYHTGGAVQSYGMYVNVDNANHIMQLKKPTNQAYYAGIIQLVAYNGELMLGIRTVKNQPNLYGAVTIDLFELPGRPLVKGV